MVKKSFKVLCEKQVKFQAQGTFHPLSIARDQRVKRPNTYSAQVNKGSKISQFLIQTLPPADFGTRLQHFLRPSWRYKNVQFGGPNFQEIWTRPKSICSPFLGTNQKSEWKKTGPQKCISFNIRNIEKSFLDQKCSLSCIQALGKVRTFSGPFFSS